MGYLQCNSVQSVTERNKDNGIPNWGLARRMIRMFHALGRIAPNMDVKKNTEKIINFQEINFYKIVDYFFCNTIIGAVESEISDVRAARQQGVGRTNVINFSPPPLRVLYRVTHCWVIDSSLVGPQSSSIRRSFATDENLVLSRVRCNAMRHMWRKTSCLHESGVNGVTSPPPSRSWR